MDQVAAVGVGDEEEAHVFGLRSGLRILAHCHIGDMGLLQVVDWLAGGVEYSGPWHVDGCWSEKGFGSRLGCSCRFGRHGGGSGGG